MKLNRNNTTMRRFEIITSRTERAIIAANGNLAVFEESMLRRACSSGTVKPTVRGMSRAVFLASQRLASEMLSEQYRWEQEQLRNPPWTRAIKGK